MHSGSLPLSNNRKFPPFPENQTYTIIFACVCGIISWFLRCLSALLENGASEIPEASSKPNMNWIHIWHYSYGTRTAMLSLNYLEYLMGHLRVDAGLEHTLGLHWLFRQELPLKGHARDKLHWLGEKHWLFFFAEVLYLREWKRFSRNSLVS